MVEHIWQQTLNELTVHAGELNTQLNKRINRCTSQIQETNSRVLADFEHLTQSGKVKSRAKMEDSFEFRQWDELIPDALGLIFRNLSLQEVLTIVPRVCKSWEKARGPYCWQEIDIEEWSKNHCPDNLDRMLQLLITRSCGSLLAVVTKLEPELLEAIGSTVNVSLVCVEQCILLRLAGKLSQDDEALAIASTMPNLKQLEIAYMLVGTTSIIEVLKGADALSYWIFSEYSSSSGYVRWWDFVAGDMDDDNDFDEISDVYWEDDQDIMISKCGFMMT
ncbi:hypothetical protein HAX54_004288 [Datura stramonium]|uniref:F-box domain-containing protein n=1 Tax=Datura stramonium TaxID=4076 RepID=A0ABS8WWV0_DATST|nr:hypothetical protein [Datura stramonium]